MRLSGGMRRILRAAGLAVILLCIGTLSGPVSAQQTNWVTVQTIRDLAGAVSLQSGQPLLAGHSYNLTVAVNVPFSQPTSDFEVTLDSRMNAGGPQFWYIATASYGGYDPSQFTPGSRTISFKQVQGDLALSAVFSVPSDFTISDSGGLRLRFPADNYRLLAVTVTGGSVVGEVKAKISDGTIENYLNAYAQGSTLISAGKIDSTYARFVNDVLKRSQALYGLGLAEEATTLLVVLDPGAFPAPPNSAVITYLTAAMGVSAALAVVFVILVLRGRTKSGYANLVVNGVQKEIAALEITAAQYDKNLADRLKVMRDKLGEAT